MKRGNRTERDGRAKRDDRTSAPAGIALPIAAVEGDAIFLVVGGFLLGLYLVYTGFDDWQRSRLIEDTPTAKVRSMSVGLVELEGTVGSGEETVHAPLLEADCAYLDWEAEEREKYEDDDGNTRYRWKTIASGTRAFPFELDDGTGAVTVRTDLDEPDVDITQSDHSRTMTLGRSEHPPTDVQRFVEAGGNPEEYEPDDGGGGLVGSILDTAADAMSADLDDTGQKRRYSERILPVGSHAYVLGSAEPVDGGEMTDSQADLLEVRRHDGVGEFLISDTEEDELQDRYNRWGPIKIVAGLPLSAICLYLLLA